jgi:hypothetical protein
MFHLMKRSFIDDNRRSSRLSNVSARERPGPDDQHLPLDCAAHGAPRIGRPRANELPCAPVQAR